MKRGKRFAGYNAHQGLRLKSSLQVTRDVDTHEYAKDLGLFAAHPAILETLPPLETRGTPESSSRETVETIAASFDMQLELIRQALDLTSVAVLLPDPEGRILRLRSLATVREDISPGPYPVGSGIAGALLRAGDEIAVAPVTHNFSGLPYYRTDGGVGSLPAFRLPDDSDERGGHEMAERIRKAIEGMKLNHENEEVRITMSLGLAVFPKDGEKKSILMSRADKALYHAKNSGRNRTAIWSELGW
ncbi:MAG: diguanylate cyclase [Thermodesulfobacteriota bacterium]|nr:diguanylate cyclase [Thermodesulfobacteriota bacterium]